MSSSPGRYQSKVLSFLSQKSRRWVDQSKVAARTFGDRAIWNLKVVTTWGAQVVLYPIYAVFQSTRLIGKQLQQFVRENLPQLESSIKEQDRGGGRDQGRQGEREKDSQFSNSSFVLPATDAAIQHVLEALEDVPLLELPGAMPVASLNPAKERSVNLVVSSNGNLVFTRNGSGNLEKLQPGSEFSELTISSAGELGNGAGSSGIEHQQLIIRGVASLLINHQLVLVTAENQILDILTREQQDKLRQRIIWEVAVYWRQVRSFLAHQKHLAVRNQRRPLPPPSVDRPHLFPPVRVFYQLMAWVQTGPIATAANLFQETALLPPVEESFAFKITEPLTFLPRRNQPFHAGILEACEAEAWLTFGDLWGQPNGVTAASLPFTWEKLEEEELIASTIPELPGEAGTFAALPASPNVKMPAICSTELQVQEHLRQYASSPQVTSRSLHLNTLKSKKQSPTKTRQTADNTLQVREQLSTDLKTVTASSTSSVHQRRHPSVRSTAKPLPGERSEAHPLASIANDVPHQQANVPEHKPEWIETKATVTGYVKHPLEQVLGWLDRTLSWLEKLATKLWKWLHQPP